MSRFTIDTGVLIQLSGAPRLGLKRLISEADDAIVVCANSIVEWWGGGRGHEKVLWDYSLEVVPVNKAIAQVAAMALRALAVPREEQVKVAIDATVMATAALVGGKVLYTGDCEDMQRLAEVHDLLSNVEIKPIPTA